MRRKKSVKMFLSLLLIGVLAFSTLAVYGCKKGGNGSEEASATADDIEFWSTYATELVWRDVGEYDKVKFPAEISLEAIGGETESAQIIMTTGDKAVSSYDVSVTDLHCGDEKFDKSNITVYCEKYISVAATEYYTYNGYCPDALAPLAGVKAVGENVIAKNNNQGLYISFRIPENQAAGVYTGSMTVTVGGADKVIPVSLTVANASIGVENHTKSSFSVKWGHGRGELDTTQEMTDKYIEFLMDYRLGVNHILDRSGNTEKEIKLWAQKAAQYAKNPECVSYGLSCGEKQIKTFDITYSDGRTITISKDAAFAVYDEDNLLQYFLEFFYEGLRQNVDPFEKAFFKGVDEPFMWYQDDSIVMIDSYIVKNCKNRAIEIMRAYETENTELKDKMIQSLKVLPHVITDKTVPTMFSPTMASPYGFDPEVMDLVLCPYFSSLSSEANCDSFRLFEDNELWWYGCNVPTAPFPTYHLGNTLLSPRLCSWMQAQYDIIGNLYWSCDYYRGSNDDGTNFLDDYYEGDGMRCSNCLGDGFIMYPGKKYGVDGPLPSLRLEAIRDGLEEFEMIYKLKEIYAEKGYSEDVVMNLLYETMYSGSRINTSITGGIFAAAREKLIDFLQLAQSDAKVMVKDIKNTRDKAVFEVYCADGYSLDVGGADASEQAVSGGKLYTVNLTLGSADSFAVSASVDGINLSAEFSLYKSAVFHGASEFAEDIKQDTHANGATLATSLVNASEINSSETQEKYLKLSLSEANAEREQRIRIEGSVISQNITNSAVKVVFEVYSDYDAEIPATLYYKGTKATSLVTPADTIALKKGLNEFVFTLSDDVWDRVGRIQYLLLSLGDKGDSARDGLYFVGMTVYGN